MSVRQLVSPSAEGGLASGDVPTVNFICAELHICPKQKIMKHM